MLDRSPVMCASDLMKLAHPAFCSWGTADAVARGQSCAQHIHSGWATHVSIARQSQRQLAIVSKRRLTVLGFLLDVHRDVYSLRGREW